MESIQITANAKINLALAIKYRRPDGYHELESIFQEIDFGDDLEIRKSEGIQFSSDYKALETDPANLCTAAGGLMMRSFGIPGLSIHLKKRIPVGAGLGGGSSDAAAVLKAADRLFGLGLGPAGLTRPAEHLGSDVPFFLYGKTAYVTGRGDVIKPLSGGASYHLLLVFPGIKIPTVWAYKNLDLDLTKKLHGHKFKGFEFHETGIAEFRNSYFNDFERTVFAAYPALQDIRKRVYDAGADFAAMSGSGSTIFGVFADESRARDASEILKPVFNVQLARPILG
jgi:4-diphosphocytidyl-2-C-methyl-D-erythritol kinase